MAMKLLSPPSSSLSKPTNLFFLHSNTTRPNPISVPTLLFQWTPKRFVFSKRMVVKACVKLEEKNLQESSGSEWGKVSAVLFDMDGVLCNSEEPSRRAAVEVFAEMGVETTVEDFIPFGGTGEANFLGGVASVKGVEGFDVEAAKKRFFEIYLEKYAKPDSGIGFPGALELVTQCKSKGLKVAVASSADLIKVKANLTAANLPLSLFDAIVSADAFENLKPSPDIFLAASKILDVPPSECIVIEDALAGVQAANAAKMRCIAVKTTLSEEALMRASPSIIRNQIGNISLDDILSGGSNSSNGKMLGPQLLSSASPTASEKLTERDTDSSGAANDSLFLSGFRVVRRDIVKYGSLGIALSCLAFTVSNWKAMQYASPKAIWNVLFGVSQPSIADKEGESKMERIQQFVNYISDLEIRGTAPIVPEFPEKLDWLNSAPIKLSKDLKGKVVVLDFWTYCCINCMHVLPDLEFLEKKYKDMPFAVVGVHSAKFDNEKDLEAIRNAVLRYDITHPVVNDGDMYLWRELGVNSWPTFAVVAPNGRLLAQLSGEGRRKDLEDLVEAALLYYGRKNILDNAPLPLSLEKDNDPRLFTSPLKFPGKLAVDVENNRLFISDTNHNHIVVTDLDGNFIVQIGSTGEEGLRDGSFDDATFNRPQGLAYNTKKNLLYVADTENHAFREIDFVNETVRTLAGNGTKGFDYRGGGKGSTQLLNSPWDVCFHPANEKVYIAMAGSHQIWQLDTADGITRAFSGDGYERNLTGSSSSTTSFAQPSGISLSPDMTELYIADSESSSIRAVVLKAGGSRLLAGGDPYFKLSQKKILDILNTKCTTSLQNLKQAHGAALRSGHFQDHYVAGTILKCYASLHFNNFGIAFKVFDSVWRPNVFVWNIMIKGCVENYEALEAITFYGKMVGLNSPSNKFTYPMLFKACRLVQAVEEGQQIHAHVVKQQLSEDVHIRSAGIQMYASFGLVEEARRLLLDDAASSDVVCWNAMLDGYMKSGDVEAAKELFDKHMPSKNVGSWNAMVSGFARCGRLKEAREVFNEMTERDEISWSAMIDGYVQGGYHKEALEVFNEMQKEKIVIPRKFVLSSVLAACANMGALDQGKWVHGYIKKNSIQVDGVLGTALVDMYAKCGRLDMAWEVFENVKRKEVSTWNGMIGGLAMHGRVDDALDVFFKMQGNNLEPNEITFLNALSACAHGGFVDEGLTIFSSMKEMYGMQAEVEHYGCVVDMFGRAGLLEEAEQVINSMPIEPSAAVYGALLGACRIYGNVEMGERIGRILLELEPQNGGRYALLSNIYAEAGMWDDVAEVRKLMKERGVKTNPGISMVDIGGKVHEFKMGDGSHPQMKEVYLMLEKIMEKLEMEGYSPNTSQVLFDIAEEEKESALRYHSEKLAIAFGLLNTKPGTTIRVVKNLRICDDCHSAIKLFSQCYNRDIIVRDRMRYHHFRHGRCSCKDFW